MHKFSETKALVQLRRVKQGFSNYISQNYAAKAKDCRTCTIVCCQDSDFVNVNITRLEALAIWHTLKNSSRVNPEKFQEIIKRTRKAITKYNLKATGDTFSQTYSCPLFEEGIGCLVHWKAKPAPCIQHGCYEDWHDLPDTKEFAQVEHKVETLNKRVYNAQEAENYATIPIWLIRIAEEMLARELANNKEDKEVYTDDENKSS
ncbi:MAG: hypothetical protein HY819_06760 [Acidobacteria bacterium]|nr:hypothetical protein [Acidobacteriota bacterium]